MPKFTKEKEAHIKDSIPSLMSNHNGNVSAVCRELDISRDTYYSFLKKYPELSQSVKDEFEAKLDKAEDKLWEHIQSGNLTALIFFLKCQAKHRGYIEKEQVQQENTGLIKFVIANAEDHKDK